MRDVAPPETMVIFKTSNSQERSMSSIPYLNVCAITENITKPSAVLTLLHEIGHCWAMKNLNDDDKVQYLYAMQMINKCMLAENDEWALLLRQERDAWAFALKNIRPFLSKDSDEGWLTREQAKEVIDLSLQSYTDKFRQQIHYLLEQDY